MVNFEPNPSCESTGNKSSLILQRKQTPLNAVQDDSPTLEVRIDTPAAHKLNLASRLVILRITIKEAHLLEPLTRRVLRNGAHINNPQPTTIVALVGQPVNDVLVVVDGAHRRLVQPRVLGLRQVRDVEDVGGRVAVLGGAGLLLLVELVVEEEVLHVGGGDPALVGVGGAFVGGLGDLDGLGLVGYVDDCESLFVVVEADFLVGVFLVGAGVDDALRCGVLVPFLNGMLGRKNTIVYVAIFIGAPWGCGLRRVRNIDHPQTPRAVALPVRADGIDHVGLLVGDDVVGAPEVRVPRRQVFIEGESRRAVAGCFHELIQ